MSRQRLRTGVLEATTRACPHCDGTGLVRTAGSSGLSALRQIEDEAAKGKGTTITLFASQEAAIYVLNSKRADLAEIEERYGVTVEVIPEGENEGAKMRVASSGPRNEFVPKFEAIAFAEEEDDDLPYEDEDEGEFESGEEESTREQREDGEGGAGRRKRRKRRRGGRREEGQEDGGPRSAEGEEAASSDYADEDADEDAEADGDENTAPRQSGEEVVEGEGPRKRRRRGRRRRGGRNRGEGDAVNEDGSPAYEEGDEAGDEAEAPQGADGTITSDEAPEAVEAAAPKRARRRRKSAAAEAGEEPVREAPEAEAETPVEAEPVAEKPKRARRKKADVAEAEPAPVAPAAPEAAPAEAPAPEAAPAEAAEATPAPASADAEDDGQSDGPRRSGWWQRTFGE